MKNVETEVKTIHIRTPVNYICPHCGRRVDLKTDTFESSVTGHGKFKVKQYYHRDCVRRLLNNDR